MVLKFKTDTERFVVGDFEEFDLDGLELLNRVPGCGFIVKVKENTMDFHIERLRRAGRYVYRLHYNYDGYLFYTRDIFIAFNTDFDTTIEKYGLIISDPGSGHYITPKNVDPYDVVENLKKERSVGFAYLNITHFL